MTLQHTDKPTTAGNISMIASPRQRYLKEITLVNEPV